MKKIMISVAPVAATDILINPRAIARDVYECYKHGAAMVHPLRAASGGSGRRQRGGLRGRKQILEARRCPSWR